MARPCPARSARFVSPHREGEEDVLPQPRELRAHDAELGLVAARRARVVRDDLLVERRQPALPRPEVVAGDQVRGHRQVRRRGRPAALGGRRAAGTFRPLLRCVVGRGGGRGGGRVLGRHVGVLGRHIALHDRVLCDGLWAPAVKAAVAAPSKEKGARRTRGIKDKDCAIIGHSRPYMDRK